MADGKVEIGIELDGDGAVQDAEKEGRRAGQGFGDGFNSSSSGGLKKTTAALGKLAAAATLAGAATTASIGKQALDAYAQHEQLVGGVNKLFKENSAQLQSYANQAYATAGISANYYMSTVTGFSANLIRSLGGDTAAATEYANMAINDMADNAATFGKSMEEIQQTYQSLARGNYAMLDNLSLGYAGTKKGLQDLLADAEKFKAAQGEMVDYSIDSYADIVEAIHVVQDEMGITGTAAREAAQTIEGSTNMAKAAWENWLVAIANSDGDVRAATENLVNSVGAAASNIIPRIGEIVTSLGEFLIEQTPMLLDKVITSISEGGVEMSATALDFFLRFVGAIVQATPQILAALLLLLASLVVAVGNKVGEFVTKGGELIAGVAQGIKEKASMVASEIGRGISEGVDRVKNMVGDFIASGRALIEGLTSGITEGFRKARDAVSSGLSTLRSFFPFSPAKVGPFSGKGYTLYSGKALVEDFAKGMNLAKASAVNSVGSVMGDFQAAMSPTLAYGGYSSTTTSYHFGDVHLNAADAQGITAIEQLVHLIETA